MKETSDSKTRSVESDPCIVRKCDKNRHSTELRTCWTDSTPLTREVVRRIVWFLINRGRISGWTPHSSWPNRQARNESANSCCSRRYRLRTSVKIARSIGRGLYQYIEDSRRKRLGEREVETKWHHQERSISAFFAVQEAVPDVINQLNRPIKGSRTTWP
jgi:hypothetical protein